MKFGIALIGAAALLAGAGAAHAGVSAEEARQLGGALTVVGAEKAGNREGTIPEYTGGLTAAPAGLDKAKGVRPDPYASEKPLFSIDAKNMDKYADKLSEGVKALMKAQPTFRIDVYPSHRSSAHPRFVLDNTLKNATRARLSADGLSMQGAHAGIPFPIPKSGNEAMWNMLMRFNGQVVTLPKYLAYNVDSAGNRALASAGSWHQEWPYYDVSKSDDETFSRVQVFYSGPARRAGEAIMVVDPVDFGSRDRRSWQYLPGQRRVRLAPSIAYDTPNPSTAGMSTYDDVSLFNGKQDRYEFKLVGKKEMFVPYNTYRLVYGGNADEVFGPRHINPDVVRWELHRMWVVEARLKEGERHIYPRRTFYLDEDSWSPSMSDAYDARGQLWRVGLAYIAPAYEVPAQGTLTSGHYDLVSGSYYLNQWPSTNGMKVHEKTLPDAQWSPDVLAGQGVR